MGGEWRTVQELQSEGVLLVEDGNHGENRPRSDEFGAKGTAFVRAADLSDGRVDFARCERVNQAAIRRIRKGVGRPNDIILSHKGTVGKLARVSDDAPPFVCSPQTTFWRVLDTERLNREFLYAFMGSPSFRGQLNAVQGETNMAPYVSLTAQRRLLIPTPTLVQQESIGRLLGALDDKIELNRLMAETLEAMARALFKSWFVDFDPVRTAAEGRPNGLPDDLFPENYEANGLPSGWATSRVGGLFDIIGGNTPSTTAPENWDGHHPWATPKDLSGISYPVLLRTERRITDLGLARSTSGLLPTGSLLLSSRAPIGYMAFASRPVAINQGFAGFVKREISAAYAWGWCCENMTVIRGNAGGSTFPEISKSVLRGLPMLKPPRAVLAAFDTAVAPLIDRLIAAAEQTQTLIALRDTLLPKLISGELSVRDGAHAVVAA